jgi:hypothetical protein
VFVGVFVSLPLRLVLPSSPSPSPSPSSSEGVYVSTGPDERRHPAGEARGKILEARVAARQPRPRHNIFHDDSGQTEKNTFSNHYPLLILYKGHLHGLS